MSESITKLPIESLPLWLPSERIGYGLRYILTSFCIMEGVHLIFLRYCFRKQSGGEGKQQQQRNNNSPMKQRLSKTAVQFTHISVCGTLATLGVYYWYFVLADGGIPIGFDERFTGHTDMGLFGYIMIAYNIWSAYVAWLIGSGEGMAMTFHHIMTTLCGILAGFTHHGWRYYSPFFGGVMEISSFPLAIMNAFKARPDWIESMPKTYLRVRICFAVAFILVRGVLWFKCIFPFMGDQWSVISSAKYATVVRYNTCIASFMPAVLLSFLQVFWLQIILKALFKMVIKVKPDKMQRRD
mmetsp:Transcript_41500/g.60874  ORF Transcript_41500/g.60874 Transcript_41500/m.60874 type:complete len:297 (+) Transcript_41500:135-1025(+)|eukprot:CAMPEP_0195521502 /NCGR_PEP_ID=MMETSP0794_2-20130614/18827_1 /TAXON_ID=515487 /ORGANISM="Stephanopyxis turris, Strain CCMP 815" /LENGTH=296 /DNA_ID=CAMNT_0040651073 /DNA_START=122 /DNA_END=1012 /DNA_ORIENTATION=-